MAFLGEMKVSAFDRQLHSERLRNQNNLATVGTSFPQGSMFESDGNYDALRNQKLLRWSFAGYSSVHSLTPMKVLTPPSITAILQKSYKPRWHESALNWD